MGGLTKKELRTEKDLTPKQKMFVEIMVQDHGQITQAEALKVQVMIVKILIVLDLQLLNY